MPKGIHAYLFHLFTCVATSLVVASASLLDRLQVICTNINDNNNVSFVYIFMYRFVIASASLLDRMQFICTVIIIILFNFTFSQSLLADLGLYVYYHLT